MGVYVTGDIHGEVHRLSNNSFYEQKEFNGNKDENVMIICGDFGLVWNREEESNEEKHWLKWLEEKPFTTVFVDGNHENHKRLATYPVKEWNGGKVHEIRQHVFHLIRGEIYTIEDKRFFAFGGASSHDIKDGIIDYNNGNWKEKAKKLCKDGKYMFRIRDLSWWKEELPSQEEMNNGIVNLEKYNWKVDYVITHSPPTSIIALLGKGLYKQDILTKYLEDIRSKLDYKYHFMGHMHIDRNMNEKDILLYENILRIV